MESIVPIAKGIFWLGVNDRETGLFEAIWPLPDGVSYNSYLIVDEKVALIDTVKKSFIPEYLEKIRGAIGEKRQIDYLVINHIEPDHSGAVKTLLELFPAMKIVGNEKTADFLKCFYGISKNVLVVKDAEILSLGARRLKFFMTPMVHWPETMMSYEETGKIIFSGDVFGGFGALTEIFDDEARQDFFENETLRYFSNVIGKYSKMVQKAIARLQGLDIHLVASTHGPVYKNNPRRIIDLYDKWSRHEVENGAVVVYGSMYGNTEKMAGAIADSLLAAGVKVLKMYNVSKTNISFIITDIWRYKALILGAPTYNTRIFPLLEHLLNVIENDNITNHILGVFGSYGWSGGSVATLRDFAQKGRWEIIDPIIEARCSPAEQDLKACAQLGKNIARRLI